MLSKGEPMPIVKSRVRQKAHSYSFEVLKEANFLRFFIVTKYGFSTNARNWKMGLRMYTPKNPRCIRHSTKGIMQNAP
jgi:hypothetical protein